MASGYNRREDAAGWYSGKWVRYHGYVSQGCICVWRTGSVMLAIWEAMKFHCAGSTDLVMNRKVCTSLVKTRLRSRVFCETDVANDANGE
jgi:hypothetical protein